MFFFTNHLHTSFWMRTWPFQTKKKFSKNLEKPVPSPFSKLFSRKNKQHDTILILGLKQATSMLSDAPTIISILHPQPARFASKVASWKQNSKIWKSQFLNFSGQSYRKFCPKRKFQPSLLSNIFFVVYPRPYPF